MDNITTDILLEFLYGKFAVTFIFCSVGSVIRESIRIKKKDESNIINIKRMATSSVFSTFLMCACSGYIELPFEVYAGISVLCGMWGLVIMNIAISEKFISKFFINISKKITEPIVRSAAEIASDYMNDQENNNNDNKDDI